jgi:hypothetical protein
VNLKGFRTKLWPMHILSGYVYLAGRVAGKQPPTATNWSLVKSKKE